jgi:acyl-CoA dehydrogenase
MTAQTLTPSETAGGLCPPPEWTAAPLTASTQELRDLITDFVQREAIPLEEEIDRTHKLPPSLWQKLASDPYRLIGAVIPKEYGGRGATYVECCVIMEELGYSSFSLATCVETTTIVPTYLMQSASEELLKEFLPAIASYETYIGIAITDMNGGTDPAAMSTCFSCGDGEYRLQGKKRLVSLADNCNAFIVMAREESTGARGALTAFLIDADTPGLRLAEEEFCFGMRGHTTWIVELDDCVVPASRRLGDEGRAMQYLFRTLDRTRGSYATGALGVARRALDVATEFAMRTETFGKRLIENQSIHFPLIEIRARLEAARLLAHKSSAAADAGQPNRVDTSLAKVLAGAIAIDAASLAITVLGGRGTTSDSVAQRLLRDSHTLQFGQGSPNAQFIGLAHDFYGVRP